jgi:hypothetical protein
MLCLNGVSTAITRELDWLIMYNQTLTPWTLGLVMALSTAAGTVVVLTGNQAWAQNCYQRNGTTYCCDANGNCQKR